MELVLDSPIDYSSQVGFYAFFEVDYFGFRFIKSDFYILFGFD